MMKIYDVKNELEKIAKLMPELRKELDEAYTLEHGKKSRLKEIWKEHEGELKEIMNSKEYRTLQ